MSFYIRKSISFGPIRLNISKSGIGISAGVKGARVATGPNGTYVHIGANGVYYRKRLDGSVGEVNSSTQNAASDGAPTVSTTTTDVVERINSRIRLPTIAWTVPLVSTLIAFAVCVLGTAMIFSIAAVSDGRLSVVCVPAFLVLCTTILVFWIVSFWVAWVTNKQETLARTTTLRYEIDNEFALKLRGLGKGLHALLSTNRIFRFRSLANSFDTRRNAGLAVEVDRETALLSRVMPPFLNVGFTVFELALSNAKIYFMPDQLFVYHGGQYGVIPYQTLQLQLSTIDVTEKQIAAPPDSLVVDWRWLYSNKDGSPDRRFNNNRQVPTIRYACVSISSSNGIVAELHVSSLQFAQQFVTEFQKFLGCAHDFDARSRDNARNEEPKKNHHWNSKAAARSSNEDDYRTLGVSSSATWPEIVAAYRKMASMYHPDKVHSLAPEYQVIAEARMKEITLAYENLKRIHES